MTESLRSAVMKLKRAEYHIDKLDLAVDAFLKSEPYQLVCEINKDLTEQVFRIKVSEMPDEIENTADDAIHNIRIPLDKMLGAYANDLSAKKIRFPIGESEKSFRDGVRYQRKFLPKNVVNFIESIEAFPGGKGEIFSIIHDIDNGIKHRSVITPIHLGVTDRQFKSLGVFDGRLLVMGSRSGKHMVPQSDVYPGRLSLIAEKIEHRPIFRTDGKDSWLEFSSDRSDMEVLTTTVGARIVFDFKPSLSIALDRTGPFNNFSAVEALKSMASAVRNLVSEYGDTFFK